MRCRVTFVCAALGTGGAETQLATMLERRPRELECGVIYLNDVFDRSRESLIPRLVNAGVEVKHIPMRRATPARVLALAEEMFRRSPDAVHTFLTGSPGTWGRVAAILAGVPTIVHSDRSLNPPVSRVHRLLRPALDARTSLVVVNARSIRSWLIGAGVPENRIVVVENPVDAQRFQRNPATCRSKEFVLGYLGRFRAEKRVELIVRALSLLPPVERPDRVLLGGTGPTMDLVVSEVGHDAWLKKNVEFCGHVDDASAFMSSIDVLVLPSDYEGQPNVALEAMAACVPVIATDVSDNRALLDGCGVVVPTNDPGSLAIAIAEMRAIGRQERRRLGTAGRDRVLEHHDIDKQVALFWRAHVSAIARANGR